MSDLPSNQSSNIIAGTNMTITFIETEGAYWTITFESTGGAGGGHTIQDDDVAQTARTNLSFQDGFVVTDDAVGDQSEIDLSYGAAGYPLDVADTEADGTAITVARSDHVHSGAAYLKEADFDDIDFLVGTATAHTAAEIVVGTTPGGELGGTWASPTVDATHSGSTHSAATDTHIADATDAHDASAISVLDSAAQITATEVEGALAEIVDASQAHDAAADPHTGYRLESADHTHTTTGLQAGTLDHGTALTGLTDDDHTQYRLESADHTHQSTGAQAGTLDHGLALTGLTDDDHTQYRKETDIVEHVTFSKEGNLSTGTGTIRWYNDTGRSITLQSARGSVGTAPTTQSILIDINNNGTTVWSTQANRITIAAGTNTDEGGAFDDSTIADGEYITVDIDQVGSGTVGADLSVTIWYTS
jgi:hypothetical protein